MLKQNILDTFYKEGVLLLDLKISSSTVEELRDECANLALSESDDSYIEAGKEHPRALLGITKKSKLFDNISRSSPFLPIAKQVLQTSDVYLHQAKVNMKAPFKGHSWAWHQDYATWGPIDNCPSDKMLNIFLFLDDITELSGCLYIINRSHKKGVLPGQWEDNVAYPLFSTSHSVVSELFDNGVTPLIGKAGTIAIVHPSSVHGSNANLSPKPRRLIHFGYNRCDNHPTEINYKRKDVQANRDFSPLEAL
jgi:ectoine hydroxylase